ncbi:hypothetical protein IP69_17205 [Bosea sp. AAP35]|uniref:hypothetical protein n=1 Tax=Bosea sp. AAP35 TaxID=1523417 RepID=UPI0006B96A7A|nr:hypothetical protein [Bosea sp. AAP35]KPF65743.1 hypothetical protein IP69_17205 [Bosea sp. AAP35]
MIYISYGMTKSASTFLYQMTEEVFKASGRPVLRLGEPFRRFDSLENYFNVVDHDLLQRIMQHVGPADIVLKTHGPPGHDIVNLVANQEILASASIRDPREVALSMIDHGARARRWRNVPFSEFVTVADTFDALDLQVGFFEAWATIEPVKVFTYNEICYDSAGVIEAIAQQIGAAVDVERVLSRFRSKGAIGQFSKGKALRYSEMSATDQGLFLERYAPLYARFAFDTEKARHVAALQVDKTLRPSGELAQHIINFRRRFGI